MKKRTFLLVTLFFAFATIQAASPSERIPLFELFNNGKKMDLKFGVKKNKLKKICIALAENEEYLGEEISLQLTVARGTKQLSNISLSDYQELKYFNLKSWLKSMKIQANDRLIFEFKEKNAKPKDQESRIMTVYVF